MGEVSTPNSCVVQGSTIYVYVKIYKEPVKLIHEGRRKDGDYLCMIEGQWCGENTKRFL